MIGELVREEPCLHCGELGVIPLERQETYVVHQGELYDGIVWKVLCLSCGYYSDIFWQGQPVKVADAG